MEKRRALVRFGPWGLAVMIAAGMILLRDILTPFLLAAMVAYLLNPLVTRLERKGRLSRGTVVAGLVLTLMIVISIVVPFVVYKVVVEARALIDSLPKLVENLTQQITQEHGSRMPEWLRKRLYQVMERGEGVFLNLIGGQVGAQQGPGLKQVVTEVLGSLMKGIGGVTSLLLDGLIFIVVTAYMLKDFQKMIDFFRNLIPRQIAPLILDVMGQIDEHLRSFFRGALTVVCLLTTFYIVGLLIIGVPFSYLIGALAGVANLIPTVGPLMTTVIALMATWMHSHEWQKLVAVAGLFIFAQVVDNTILTPKVVGDKVGLHPALIIFSMMACGKFLGFFGVILAVPIAATVKVILSVVVARYRDSPVFTGVVEQ